jgi:membrane-bound lytic murein transglycosylase A
MKYLVGVVCAALMLSGCAVMEPLKKQSSTDKIKFEKADFAALPNWQNDDAAQALSAFSKSCGRILRADPAQGFHKDGWGGSLKEWQAVCRDLPLTKDPQIARQFFENYFDVYAVTNDGDADGLFTGYFEASLRGSLTREGAFQIPLRARPDDLVMVDLGEFRDELKGQRIAGRVRDGRLRPYEDRSAIEDGKLPPAQDKPILYTDDAVGAFFMEIQGSGIVTLPDGSIKRLGFDGQNGHVYTAIGKELVARGALSKDNVSMQSITEWLRANPAEGREVMRTNKSYVFFRAIDGDGPIGGEGIALTPHRSLAIDRSLIGYGAPLYLSANPVEKNDARIERLMVAQDTGGAIRGPVRGDVFWGYGQEAAHKAGLMQSRGRYWILVPRGVSMTSAR